MITTPVPPLAEMTSRALGVVPPMVFEDAPLTISTPLTPLPIPAVPAALVPIKSPATVLLDVPVSDR